MNQNKSSFLVVSVRHFVTVMKRLTHTGGLKLGVSRRERRELIFG
jgi:hypothetical protein